MRRCRWRSVHAIMESIPVVPASNGRFELKYQTRKHHRRERHGGMERGAWRSYGEGGVRKITKVAYSGALQSLVVGGASTTTVALW